MRRVWEFAEVTGAWLLLAALLLFGGQQALLGAEVQAGEAGIWPLAGNAIRQSGGVVVEPTSLIVSEPADSNTFRLYLTGVPTKSVSISLAATTAECLVSPAVVVLDAGNWELGATATVTAVDDAIADGDMDCTIQTGLTTSDDDNYDGLEVDDVGVTVKDDDEVGILVAPTSLTVSEPSSSDTFLVRLNSQPEAEVYVPLTASSNQCIVSPGQLVLDAGNWELGATATVTAVDDAIADGDMDCTIQTGLTTSDDDNYDGLEVDDVAVTVEDDDEVGILVSPTSLVVSEPSGSDTFLVRLNSQPEAEVYVPLTASSNQCIVSPGQLALNAGNWEAGVTATVTAVNDAIADGDMDCTIQTGPTTSADDNYDGLQVDDVAVTVEDDDEVGIPVVPTSLTVSEPNGSDTFRIRLNSQPVYSVYVPLSAVGECSISRSYVWLTPYNWSMGYSITVTAIDDLVADGTTTCMVELGPSRSDDDQYDGYEIDSVTVAVEDNDVASVVISPLSLAVSEPDGSATFNVKLTSHPLAQVSVPLTASNSQCSVSPATAVLNVGNWASGVTATVRAVDDDVADGDVECTIQTGPTASADSDYRDLDPDNVSVLVVDDDEANIMVAPTTLTVSEPSGSDTFVVRLASRPVYAVSVPLSTFTAECSVSPGQLVLDAENWELGATATVTAVDDAIADGDMDCLVQTGTTTSDDDQYNLRNPADVAVTVEDDDEVGILVSPTSLTVSEPNGSDTFHIRLNSQPVYSVYVPLSAVGECSISRSYVWLTASNWSTGYDITVTAIDDLVADGTTTCMVELGPSRSDDGQYDGYEIDSVTVAVEDDDQVGVVVTPTSLTVREPDGVGISTFSLTSEPTATVTIGLTPSNGECSPSPTSVVLGAGNWWTGVAVSIRAVDDNEMDGTQTCVVRTSRTSSAAPQYNSLEVQDITVTVQDDERWQQCYLPLTLVRWPPLPGVPTLYPITNPDGIGTYTVAWSAAERAETYILEEASVSTFATARQVYSGPATSHPISGRGAARYYYRVKAMTEWAYGGWSNVQQVDVLWEAEPNNEALSEANGPLVSRLTYYGTFPGVDDIQDYYYFDMPTARSVVVDLTNIPAGRDYNLLLRDASLTQIGYKGTTGNANEHLTTDSLPPGRYYIQVYRYSGVGSTEPYNLRVIYQ